jgi:hypothetical protein
MPAPATEKSGQKAGSSTRPLKNGQTTPPVEASEIEQKAAGKPDQAAFNLEQENLKKEIDEAHKKLVRLFSSLGQPNIRNLLMRDILVNNQG